MKITIAPERAMALARAFAVPQAIALASAPAMAAIKGMTVAVAAALLLCSAAARAQAQPAGAARGAEADAAGSPRWMYELMGGYFYPNLDDYDVFYGDGRDTFFAVSGGYRLREWFEVGAEIGHRRDRGFGLTASGDPGGAVELRLVPLHVFANFIYQRPGRRLVPYAGIGLSSTWYEQDIELQPGRDGRSDVGGSVRVGLRWLITSEGSREAAARRRDTIYWRSYVFLEAQKIETEIDDVDLGGKVYMLGYRVEFELGRDSTAR